MRTLTAILALLGTFAACLFIPMTGLTFLFVLGEMSANLILLCKRTPQPQFLSLARYFRDNRTGFWFRARCVLADTPRSLTGRNGREAVYRLKPALMRPKRKRENDVLPSKQVFGSGSDNGGALFPCGC